MNEADFILLVQILLSHSFSGVGLFISTWKVNKAKPLITAGVLICYVLFPPAQSVSSPGTLRGEPDQLIVRCLYGYRKDIA